MNNSTFAGRIGRDAETRFTKGGDSVTGFSLAVDQYQGKGKEKGTLWVDCSMWGERGESIAQYLTQGSAVSVSGEVGVRTYESKGETQGALTLRVRELTLLGKGKGEGAPQRETRQAPQRQERGAARRQAAPAGDFEDDGIPF